MPDMCPWLQQPYRMLDHRWIGNTRGKIGDPEMTKAELINKIASTSDLSRRATEEVVNATFETLAKGLKKTKRIQVPGFGTFLVRTRKARVGRSPRTGATIKIKASRTVTFKAAPSFKKEL
jgi:DNA-binding protein HU-beta